MDKSSGMFRHCSIFFSPVTRKPPFWPGALSSLQQSEGL